jgi:myo-inositol-1(or 4)-monophosphatase
MKDFLHEIVSAAGAISLDYRSRLEDIEITHKSRKDIVTEADIAVEDYLVGRIEERYPDHAILGEETGSHEGSSGYRWIIDPIDGTVSFVRGQAYYSISIALEKDGEFVLGAVYAPVLDELFTAEKGEGAFLNGEPITVSKEDDLSLCLMATGFACMRYDSKRNNIAYFTKVMPQIADIRRCGSAAIDMCYVACGRVDGFWELELNIYDLAAGVLIAKEAGAEITDFSGDSVTDYKEIVCTNALVHGKLVNILSD